MLMRGVLPLPAFRRIVHASERRPYPARVTWFHYSLVATFVFEGGGNDIFMAVRLAAALENGLGG
jgi:hypothetical protein